MMQSMNMMICVSLVIQQMVLGSLHHNPSTPKQTPKQRFMQDNTREDKVFNIIQKHIDRKDSHNSFWNYVKDRLSQSVVELTKLAASSPKSRSGLLENNVARYILQKNLQANWSITIQGLSPWHSHLAEHSSPLGIFKAIVGDHTRRVYNEFFGYYEASEWSTFDLALISSVFQASVMKELMLVMEESVQNLPDLDSALLKHRKTFKREEIKSFLTAFTAYYVSSKMNFGNSLEDLLTKKDGPFFDWDAVLDMLLNTIDTIFKGGLGFNDHVGFLRAVDADAIPLHDFTNILETVTKAIHKYETTNECDKMRNKLLSTPHAVKTGRYPLHLFYKEDGNQTTFTENPSYLMSLGTIIEIDGDDGPSVLVANYMHSATNCLDWSSHYDVCCPDICESRFTVIEHAIDGPLGKADVILKVVSRMSDSPPSTNLIHRLHEIEKVNGGSVPIHGRLFAQWMHYIFPSECEFMHSTSNLESIRRTSPEAWEANTGAEAEITLATIDEQLSEYLDRSRLNQTLKAKQFHWDHDNVLLGYHSESFYFLFLKKLMKFIFMSLLALVTFGSLCVTFDNKSQSQFRSAMFKCKEHLV